MCAAHKAYKIFPEVLEFDPQNPLHKEFLIAAANLYACVFKVGWLWGALFAWGLDGGGGCLG